MKIRDLKIAWRILLKQPAHSLIVFLGLSVSFGVCFLLLGYAKYSFEYDGHVPDAKRIFLVKHRLNVIAYPAWIDFNVWPLKQSLGQSGIPHTLTFVDIDTLSVSTASGSTSKILVATADSNFPNMFAVKALQGDLLATLARPDAVALTAEIASRLFGSKSPLGNRVDIEGKPYYVGALIKDLPNNSTVTFAVLKGGAREDYSRAYIQLPTNVDVKMVEDRLQDVADKSPFSKALLKHVATTVENVARKRAIEIRLTSLADAYFDRDLVGRKNLVRGDERTVFALIGAAFLLVFLAATSFINLSVARTLRRQKEVGIYKILGASRARIVAQFVTESLCLSFAATSLGLLLAWLILPLFSDLMNRQLDDLFSFSNIVVSLLFSVLIGFVMSIYPTWLALCVNAHQAMVGRGNSETLNGARLRRVLTILQFACAMSFGAISLAIAWQTYYSTKTNLGFEPNHLLVLTLAQSIEDSEANAFRDALLRLPRVEDVAVSFWSVGKDVTGVDFVPLRASNGQYVMPNLEGISLNFFSVHGIKSLAGRVFDPTLDAPKYADKIVLNLAAVSALGFSTPQSAIGQFVVDNRDKPRSVQIIGVVPNVRYRSAHNPEVPRIFIPAFWPHTFTIRTDGNLSEATMQITNLWRQYFPSQVVDIKTSTSLIAQNYEEDLRMSKLLIIAAILSLAIAAFGIYVLSAYSVQRRFQEIAIRKIYGAKTKSIALLLGKEFGFIMLASALIGLPLGALAISYYLASFVERAPIGGWTLLFALSVALLIALASSLRHALLAMRISPVVALRD
ncbi:ABC transporter permease [Undibacterium flavidum]|uniref:ABC transporter permease n=1 Tax=Undibacterium flavidum TaxID=2762297 RepID=A0ABR6YGP7_9BURK|nr:ABC transporter permease [Undibacterium flavidum]MBC3875692.1 ABC transporter permease [Undibacterium flavidum]